MESVPWSGVLVTVVLAVLIKLFFTFAMRNPLDSESGRRSAWRSYRKDSAYYLARGVRASEAFVRNSRGVEIFTKQWLPANGVLRGIVFYCHGYGDTCAYFFEDVAMRLTRAQYAVVGMDYEGHGQSQGLHCYIKRFDNIVDDVAEFAAQLRAKEEFHGLPFFLYGESMGGAVALKLHMHHPVGWDGAILVAPMCKISKDVQPPAIVIVLLKMLAWLLPTAQLVPTRDICEITFRVPEKRQMGYDNPTAFKGRPRLWTAVQMLAATDEIGANLEKVTLPMLILHGAADMVTDPAISAALYERAQSRDKVLRTYEDSWHSLLGGEPDDVVEVVMDDIIMWLDARSLPLGMAREAFPKTLVKTLGSSTGDLGAVAAAESDEDSTVTG